MRTVFHGFINVTIVIIIVLLVYLLAYLRGTYLLTAVELSLGGSNPHTSTDKTNKNKYT